MAKSSMPSLTPKLPVELYRYEHWNDANYQYPGGSSIMMAGSSSVITDFDGWFARYVWTKISAESGRFDLSNVQPQPAEPVTPPYEEPANGYFMGDINSDGQVNISDAVLLQKWFLAVPEISLPNWEVADLCKNDRLDVVYLYILKNLIISGKTPEWVGTDISEP